MPISSCNSQNVLNTVGQLAPVVIDVLIAICGATAQPAPALCSSGGDLLRADEQKVISLWQAYLDALKAGTATPDAWAALNIAVNVFMNQSADVFALIRIVNPAKQKEILLMVAAAQALLAVIEHLMPNPPATAMSMSALHSRRFLAHLPAPNVKTQKYDRQFFEQWRKGWNELPGVKARKMEIRGAGFGWLR